MVVVIEGIDASGKNTQTKLLKEHLAPYFKKIDTFDFPHYEGVAGGLVGRILRGETLITNHLGDNPTYDRAAYWSRDKALIIQCVMLTDRFEYLQTVKNHEKTTDTLMILDRYRLSGIVYGQADGLPPTWLALTQLALPLPDLTFILDIPVEESVRRRPERRDYYEKNLEKLKQVRKLYLDHAVGRDTIRVIDGRMPPDVVTSSIAEFVMQAKFVCAA